MVVDRFCAAGWCYRAWPAVSGAVRCGNAALVYEPPELAGTIREGRAAAKDQPVRAVRRIQILLALLELEPVPTATRRHEPP